MESNLDTTYRTLLTKMPRGQIVLEDCYEALEKVIQDVENYVDVSARLGWAVREFFTRFGSAGRYAIKESKNQWSRNKNSELEQKKRKSLSGKESLNMKSVQFGEFFAKIQQNSSKKISSIWCFFRKTENGQWFRNKATFTVIPNVPSHGVMLKIQLEVAKDRIRLNHIVWNFF